MKTTTLKKSGGLLAAVLLAVAGLIPAAACGQSAPYWVGNFWGASTDIGADFTYYVVPRLTGDYAANTQTRIQWVNMTSDKADSALSIAVCTNGATLGTGGITNLLRFAATAHGVVSNDVVVVEDVSAAAYGWARAIAVTTTSITLSGAGVAFVPASGDRVYEASVAAQIPCGSGTVTLAPSGYLAEAQSDAPVLLSLDGTAACQINLVNGEYRRR